MSNMTLRAGALAAAIALTTLAAPAHASTTVFSTGLPSGGVLMSDTIDSSDWLAERFTLSSATTLDSISAYVLSLDSSDVGKTFTIALYADQGGLPALNFGAANQGQLAQATATYTADGWNGVSSLNWSLAAGSYWVALEGGSDASSAVYLQAPTGALPAADAVAYYAGSGPRYTLTGSSETFGVQISAVPEPATWSLALLSLGLVGVARRRRG